MQTITGFQVAFYSSVGTKCVINPICSSGPLCNTSDSACCPDYCIPDTLCATILLPGGKSCAGTFTLQYNLATLHWESSVTDWCGCGSGFTFPIFTLYCEPKFPSGIEWKFLFNGNSPQLVTAHSVVCGPLYMQADVNMGCGVAYDGVTVYISECGDINFTTCCPSVGLPHTLYAHVTGAGLSNGVYPLTFIGGTNWSGLSGTCLLSLFCDPATAWTFHISGLGNIVATSVDCSPLQLVFTGVDFSSCGGTSGGTVTILTS